MWRHFYGIFFLVRCVMISVLLITGWTDAATAVDAALQAPAGTFNIVDDEPLTKRGYADALAHAADTTLWLRGPGRAALLFGDRLTSLTRSLRVSNTRFRIATGWAPRYPSAREGWLATATGLRRAA
jgi:nucleoside-diphosphate-sugar epimerase